ncbi:MAG: rhomboid family intramembrane serine protease [Anaerolineae bacterium]|jgi:membrane associated rhomboid family serine protease|nr:rhomboid family intramembrane serine protease [Chloroflexota bacterium]
MIPLRDTIQSRRLPLANYAIILINILVLIHVQLLPPSEAEALLQSRGVVPTRFLSEMGRAQLETLFTSMFLHGGWLHLISNMWALYIFGDNIEDRLGAIQYLLLYLTGGAIATLVHIQLNQGSSVPVVGASGAIAAVMGAYLVSYPRARVLTFVPLPLVWFIKLPAVLYLLGWFALQLLSGLQTISLTTADSAAGGIAWWAHVGGFLAGILLILLLPGSRRPASGYLDEYRPW